MSLIEFRNVTKTYGQGAAAFPGAQGREFQYRARAVCVADGAVAQANPR